MATIPDYPVHPFQLIFIFHQKEDDISLLLMILGQVKNFFKQVLKMIVKLVGDVILREEPYAAVLESVFRVNHCAHCLRKTPTPIPCYECATVSCL
jgi:hypothetical protein